MPVAAQECAHACARGWLRFVYNHNPFYVVSAVLVLYGLHVSFAESLNPSEGWLFTQILMGYILLLAATGVLVVRLGQVWEDARTLILLVALLMVALASSFDRVCLDDEYQGARFLACGLAFSLILSEILIRVLRLRFPVTYRLAFYSLLTLLFAYPAWLGHLSLEDRVNEMAWYVMAFPAIAGLLSLVLVPAARLRGADVSDNGTPWGWPLYPWSLFVLLAVGILLRSYAVSMSFDPTKGSGSGFQLFFLAPLALCWFLIWFEGSDQSLPDRSYIAAAWPFGLFAISLPGQSVSAAEFRYIALLRDTLGSPVQIIAVMLIAYYAYIWLRGNRRIEFGMLSSLGVLAVVDRNTLDMESLAPYSAAPLAAIVAVLAIGSWRRKSSPRLALATIIAIAAITYETRDTVFTYFHGYLPIHLLFFALISLGLLFHDSHGKLIARRAAVILAFVSIIALIGYRFLFPGVPAMLHALVAVAFAAMAAAYWVKNRSFADLKAVVVCLAVSAAFVAEHFVGRALGNLILQGKQWIAWGAASFLMGLLISLIKAGQIRSLQRALKRLHVSTLGSARNP